MVAWSPGTTACRRATHRKREPRGGPACVAAAAAWPNPAGGAEHVPFVNSKLSIDPGRSSSTTWDTIVTRTYVRHLRARQVEKDGRIPPICRILPCFLVTLKLKALSLIGTHENYWSKQ
jgi:hypothetical protein